MLAHIVGRHAVLGRRLEQPHGLCAKGRNESAVTCPLGSSRMVGRMIGWTRVSIHAGPRVNAGSRRREWPPRCSRLEGCERDETIALLLEPSRDASSFGCVAAKRVEKLTRARESW